MGLIIKSSFKKKVSSLYEEYVQRFLEEWNHNGSYVPCVLIGDEEEGNGIQNESFPDEQMEFIRLYLGHMMLSGDSNAHLEEIEHFLSMQGAINTNDRMEFRFLLGNPPEVFVYVDNLIDIDMADTYGLTGFQTMHIYNAREKKWTQRAIKKLLREIKEDFEFDGYEPQFDCWHSGPFFEIKCRIKE